MINVKDYGATGDGVTDDTTAILAAIADVPAGGEMVFFPAGTYIISDQLVLPESTTVSGTGPSTIIHQTSAGKSGIVYDDNNLLKDFVLLGNNGEATHVPNEVGLYAGYVSISPPFTRPIDPDDWQGLDSKVLNVRVSGFGMNGVHAMGGTEVTGCTVENCGEEGILVFGDGNYIHHNAIARTLGWGIDIQGSRNRIDHNELVDVGNNAGPDWPAGDDTGGIVLNCDIWTDGTDENIIDGNAIDGSTNAGIVIMASSNYISRGNVIRGNAVKGVVQSVLGGDYAAIQVADNGTGGAVRHTLIEGNAVLDSGGRGIMAWGVAHIAINGNTVDTCAEDGIVVTSHAGVHPVHVNVSANTVRLFGLGFNGMLFTGVQSLTVTGATNSETNGTPSADYSGMR